MSTQSLDNVIYTSLNRGFTIVELLIVIVIIGILASVTVSAFNGVQGRAENTKTINAVAGYVKVLQLYKQDKGTYPPDPASDFPCFGALTTTCGTTNVGGNCWGVTAVPAGQGTSNFNGNLEQYTKNLPQPSTQTMQCNAGGSQASGALYATNAGYLIWYFLKGDTSCGTPGGLVGASLFQVNTTVCLINLP